MVGRPSCHLWLDAAKAQPGQCGFISHRERVDQFARIGLQEMRREYVVQGTVFEVDVEAERDAIEIEEFYERDEKVLAITKIAVFPVLNLA